MRFFITFIAILVVVVVVLLIVRSKKKGGKEVMTKPENPTSKNPTPPSQPSSQM